MTDLPTPSTARPAPGQLTMTAPRRGKPPRHLADLDLAGRVEWAKELGLPGFRAKQLSTHYFTHHTDDPGQMSDLPKAARDFLTNAKRPAIIVGASALTGEGGEETRDERPGPSHGGHLGRRLQFDHSRPLVVIAFFRIAGRYTNTTASRYLYTGPARIATWCVTP